MKHSRTWVCLVLLALGVSGCACRPGYIGPYGGVHPGGCWVW
jgi:hypothetical protein